LCPSLPRLHIYVHLCYKNPEYPKIALRGLRR
jgi:hypothetical protein